MAEGKKIWDVGKKSSLTGSEKLPIDMGDGQNYTTDINDIGDYVADTATTAEIDGLFEETTE